VSAEAARPLHVHDLQTGELVEASAENLALLVQSLRDEVTQHLRTIRAQASEIGKLKRDRQNEAEGDPLWPKAVDLHRFYNQTMKRRSVWKLDVFEMCEPFLKAYPVEVHRAAIHGLLADHYVDTRANGTKRHHVGWHILYRDTDRFEEAVNSAPVEMLQILREEGLLPGMTPKKKGSSPAQRSLLNDDSPPS
jgi:hypothetical protein